MATKVAPKQDRKLSVKEIKAKKAALTQAIMEASELIGENLAQDITVALLEELASYGEPFVTAQVLEAMLNTKALAQGVNLSNALTLPQNFLAAEPIKLSANAIRVLQKRYLGKDINGNVEETPRDMFMRVARHIAQAEKNYSQDAKVEAEAERKFFDLMTSLKFLPNSPTLMNAGRPLGQLAACFVLPVEDSMEAIFDSLKNAALIHKSGGGTGFSFSRLRAKNSMVGSTGGVASGPVSFMKIFNTATEQVKQGGTRRGANMGILRVDHPDILEFITCKKNNDTLNNFNISVAVTDAFMQAVTENADYDLIDPVSGQVVGTLNAADVYKLLVDNAWSNGDPGIIFIDKINADNPTPALGAIESTNPCGEQPLLPMEACNLGSINLALFVKETDGKAEIDYEDLEKVVSAAMHFLDNTIDMSIFPLPEIKKMVQGNRKVGLGVMGFADMLYKMKIGYNTEQALDAARQVMAFIQRTAIDASAELARQRGNFKNYNKSVFKDSKAPRRNATCTTIAPTGTLSILGNCSSGIEPLFALSFVRNVMDNDKLVEVNPYFEAEARALNFYSDALMEEISAKGSVHDVQAVPPALRKIYVTAHDISPEWHVRMQAAFQEFTDNAVSKTVNMPAEASVEDVREVYDLTYELGCKGITIYRDGSKEAQVLSFGKQETADTAAVRQRPDVLTGFTAKVRTGMGELYITINEMDGHPFEVFATIGKSGRSTTAKTEAIGRLISLAFRSGISVDKVVRQLKGIGGEHPVFQNGGLVLSIPDGIARILEKQYLAKEVRLSGANSLLGETCPDCGQTISFEEGCMMCHFCGFNKCG